MSGGEDWRPSASRARARKRAALLARTREFFAAREVLEVDTPLLVNAPVSDVHIHWRAVQLGQRAAGCAAGAVPAYLARVRHETPAGRR